LRAFIFPTSYTLLVLLFSAFHRLAPHQLLEAKTSVRAARARKATSERGVC
jgi:hypothetical protein